MLLTDRYIARKNSYSNRVLIAQRELTAEINVDELGEDKRHGSAWRPRHLLVHDWNDWFMKQVGQRHLFVAVMRHDKPRSQTRNHNLHQPN